MSDVEKLVERLAHDAEIIGNVVSALLDLNVTYFRNQVTFTFETTDNAMGHINSARDIVAARLKSIREAAQALSHPTGGGEKQSIGHPTSTIASTTAPSADSVQCICDDTGKPWPGCKYPHTQDSVERDDEEIRRALADVLSAPQAEEVYADGLPATATPLTDKECFVDNEFGKGETVMVPTVFARSLEQRARRAEFMLGYNLANVNKLNRKLLAERAAIGSPVPAYESTAASATERVEKK